MVFVDDILIYSWTKEDHDHYLRAGLQISANGTEVLDRLGVLDAAREIGCEPTGKQIRLWSTGQTWKLFDLGAASVERYGYPYLMIHRADLHGLLFDAVRSRAPDAIRTGARCTGFRSTDDGVTLSFADGSSSSADILVGADGVHSAVRQAMFGPDRPQFTGCMAWRGLVPMVRLPERLRAPVGTNWVGPGGHVVMYPLRRGELLNFVGIVERDDCIAYETTSSWK